MKYLAMMSFLLLGACTGEPPVHGSHHEHQGFVQPQPFQHHHDHEIEGLRTPKLDSSSYNSLSPKTSKKSYDQFSKTLSNEFRTPMFGNENPRPFSARNKMPDSMYGVPDIMVGDQGTHFNAPPALYDSPESHGTGDDYSHSHGDNLNMHEHGANTDTQGYEVNPQSQSALDMQYSNPVAGDLSDHRDSEGLPEVVAARQSVSPFRGAVEGITQAIIRPNPPLVSRNMLNLSRSHPKSPKSSKSSSKKSHLKPSPKFGAPQGYSSGPEVNKYEQKSSQHHLEVEEPSKTYLPSGRNAYENNVDLGRNGGEQNYEFEYTVNDYESASDFGHRESRQFGRTHGMYHVLLPDGRKQIVEYEADEDGFKPRISYEEPEIDTRNLSGGYDANSNNLDSKSQQGKPQNIKYNHLKQSTKGQGYPQGGIQGPY